MIIDYSRIQRVRAREISLTARRNFNYLQNRQTNVVKKSNDFVETHAKVNKNNEGEILDELFNEETVEEEQNEKAEKREPMPREKNLAKSLALMLLENKKSYSIEDLPMQSIAAQSFLYFVLPNSITLNESLEIAKQDNLISGLTEKILQHVTGNFEAGRKNPRVGDKIVINNEGNTQYTYSKEGSEGIVKIVYDTNICSVEFYKVTGGGYILRSDKPQWDISNRHMKIKTANVDGDDLLKILAYSLGRGKSTKNENKKNSLPYQDCNALAFIAAQELIRKFPLTKVFDKKIHNIDDLFAVLIMPRFFAGLEKRGIKVTESDIKDKTPYQVFDAKLKEAYKGFFEFIKARGPKKNYQANQVMLNELFGRKSLASQVCALEYFVDKRKIARAFRKEKVYGSLDYLQRKVSRQAKDFDFSIVFAEIIQEYTNRYGLYIRKEEGDIKVGETVRVSDGGSYHEGIFNGKKGEKCGWGSDMCQLTLVNGERWDYCLCRNKTELKINTCDFLADMAVKNFKGYESELEKLSEIKKFDKKKLSAIVKEKEEKYKISEYRKKIEELKSIRSNLEGIYN